MRAYILGTVAHEVVPRYEQQMNPAVFGEYYEIMNEELAPSGQPSLTEYVRKHKEAYKSSEKILFKKILRKASDPILPIQNILKRLSAVYWPGEKSSDFYLASRL